VITSSRFLIDTTWSKAYRTGSNRWRVILPLGHQVMNTFMTPPLRESIPKKRTSSILKRGRHGTIWLTVTSYILYPELARSDCTIEAGSTNYPESISDMPINSQGAKQIRWVIVTLNREDNSYVGFIFAGGEDEAWMSLIRWESLVQSHGHSLVTSWTWMEW